MKTMTTRLVLMAGALFLGANGAAAQTVVTPTADGDLRVVDYSGKPPYKRSIIRAEDSADFARFEESDSPASTRRWRGAPGKGLPRFGR